MDFSALVLVSPYGRKVALDAVDKGDTDAFNHLYSYFSAQAHMGPHSEFDYEELQNHRKLLAKRARIAFLCPSAFPTISELEKVNKVARCLWGIIVPPNIEYFDAFLNLLERKEIKENARFMMANCLKKFLCGHPDIFMLGSLPGSLHKRITTVMVGETGRVFRALDELLCAVNWRWPKMQAQSEPV